MFEWACFRKEILGSDNFLGFLNRTDPILIGYASICRGLEDVLFQQLLKRPFLSFDTLLI